MITRQKPLPGEARYGSGAGPDGGRAKFVGKVEYVGPEPAYVSGILAAYQSIGVTITDVREGAVNAGDRVEVDALVASGYPAIGVGASGLPALDSAIVQPGVLVLFDAAQCYGRWRCDALSTDGPQNVA
ncbi:MAG TPA: hypothetical protein VI356_03725 [Myxococcales bacterium]